MTSAPAARGSERESLRPESPARFGLLAAGLVLALAAAAVWVGSQRLARDRAAREAFPIASGQLRVEGLAQRVDVHRDGRGIPHILAKSEADAFFGLGFTHAQDRLAQMLWLRRIALGRAAEWIGSEGLASDRLVRTLGFARLAEQQVERIDEDVRSALTAYAGGFNARLARIRSGRVAPPVELSDRLPLASTSALDLRANFSAIEGWTASDCLVVGKLVAWSSGASHERAVVLSDMIERLGSMGARPFFPGGEAELALAVRMDQPGRAPAVVDAPSSRPSPLAVASLSATAWALAGRFTASGAPILVAEISVPVTAPSLLYEAHIRGGDLDVAGVTIPGIPVFWAGRNLDVAWASVPLPVVTVDLFKETLRRTEGSAEGDGDAIRAGVASQASPALLYQNGSRWVPVANRSESIEVAGNGDGEPRLERLLVYETRHGPLVSDLVAGETPREPLSLAWTGARPGDAVTGLSRVARAKNAAEVSAALALHHEPPLEVVYADRAGEVGVRVAGWLPRRSLPSGLVPVPGRLRGFDWRVGPDPDALPHVSIPSGAFRGQEVDAILGGGATWMVSSGTRLENELSGAWMEWLWQSPERAQRVRELVSDLARAGPVELRAAAAVLEDVAANVDPALIEALLALAGEPPDLSPEAQEVTELLRRWDGIAGPDSRGAAAFEILAAHLIDELLREPIGSELLDRYLALPGVRPEAVVQGIVIAAARGGRAGGWTDPDDVSRSVRESLRRTWMSLSYRLGHNRERWTWGRLHALAFRPFAAMEWQAKPASGTLGPFAFGGRAASVARAEQDRETFATRVASTYRMAVDLASPNRMLTSLAPGQSEHPGHPHFDDGAAAWRDARPWLLVTSPFLQEEAAVERLVLEPPR